MRPTARFRGYGYFGDTLALDPSTLTLSQATGINVPTFTDASALNPDNITPAGGTVGQAQTSSLFSNPLFLVGALLVGGAVLYALMRK